MLGWTVVQVVLRVSLPLLLLVSLRAADHEGGRTRERT